MLALAALALAAVTACSGGTAGSHAAGTTATAKPPAANPGLPAGCNANTVATYTPDYSDAAVIKGGTDNPDELFIKLVPVGDSTTIAQIMPTIKAGVTDPNIGPGVICPDGNVYKADRPQPVLTGAMIVDGSSKHPVLDDQGNPKVIRTSNGAQDLVFY